jgi:hypothetical protein
MSVGLKSKFALANTQAFYKEAGLAFIIDFCAIVVLWAFGISEFSGMESAEFNKGVLGMGCILACYLILAIFLHYNIGILQLIDIKKGDVIKCSGKIYDYKTESSLSGHLGHSNVRWFFPKEMGVDRYKLRYVDEDGKKHFVRLIMSFEKRMIVSHGFLDNKAVDYVEIQYLKRSKVLISLKAIPNKTTDERTEYALYEFSRKI